MLPGSLVHCLAKSLPPSSVKKKNNMQQTNLVEKTEETLPKDVYIRYIKWL